MRETPDIAPRLCEVFCDIRDGRRFAMRSRTAREVLGASVIRVFAPDTKPCLLERLERVDVDALPGLSNEIEFSEWFVTELCGLARVVKRCNPHRPAIYPGYKWGHATKVLALFCRDMVLRTRYFADRDAKRLVRWLYVPLDGIVIRRIRRCGVRLPFRQIREIDSKRKFFRTQHLLGVAAAKVGVPRVLFDDVWMER